MEARYLNHMGDDLTVVNAARVSFSKESEWDYQHPYYQQENVLNTKDQKLINFLAREGHWTPFAHPQISLHLKMPFFVARQIDKHQVGFVVNEVSRRYVDEEPDYYVPPIFREKADNVKQGSKDTEVEDDLWLHEEYLDFLDHVEDIYQTLLDKDVCHEQARIVLPMCSYTEQWKTGSLYAWSRLYNLRYEKTAQKETQQLAKQIGEIIEPLFPISWKALTSG